MIDLVFKNWTPQKSPGEKFFKNIIENGRDVLKLKKNLELSVNMVAEAKIKSLNKKYRKKDKATNVLSFPMGNGSGDIFICLSIAKKEAKRENISMEAKLAQFTVHGFLHLLGYDHEKSAKEAKKMFDFENKILKTLNFKLFTLNFFMARPYLISGIDIGNSQVKVVVAKIDRESLGVEILGIGSAPSNGLRRGMVVDMEETIDNIRTAVQRAEAMAGVSVKRAYLAVNGLHIKNQVSRGVIAVSRADNEISQNDIDRVIQAASVVSLPPNREMIHVLPRNFIVDGVENVKNPLGMKGVRLEAEVFIIEGLSPYLRNLAKCVNENNIEVTELVFAPLAASLSVLDKNQKEYGVLNLDFGGGTSTLTVFEEADLLHSVVLPVGSKHITADLAVALRTSMDVAERVKLEHGATSESLDLRKRENIDLSELVGEENFLWPKKQLVNVIDARAHELLDLVSAELKKISKGMLPAGVVLSGGGANLPGLAALAKEKLRLSVRIARPVSFHGSMEDQNDPSFSVAVGLVLWGLDEEFGSAKGKAALASKNTFFKKAGGWLKNFLP